MWPCTSRNVRLGYLDKDDHSVSINQSIDGDLSKDMRSKELHRSINGSMDGKKSQCIPQ